MNHIADTCLPPGRRTGHSSHPVGPPHSDLLQEVIMKSLFSPAAIGPYALKHRVVIAPLTRLRSSTGDVPNGLMATYLRRSCPVAASRCKRGQRTARLSWCDSCSIVASATRPATFESIC
ncbi:hypothetical protein [Paraburkholderia sp. MM5482-R1]|uniref:oxidoreductase n=1 Tax=unclassified Paraburkholderia TaxID=2615204 RepID=UPI003D1E4C67